jgi:hypothetical protein
MNEFHSAEMLPKSRHRDHHHSRHAYSYNMYLPTQSRYTEETVPIGSIVIAEGDNDEDDGSSTFLLPLLFASHFNRSSRTCVLESQSSLATSFTTSWCPRCCCRWVQACSDPGVYAATRISFWSNRSPCRILIHKKVVVRNNMLHCL